MCDRPDFEAMQQDMDETLISLFRQWHDFMKCWLEEDESQNVDWVKEFCEHVCNRLAAFKEMPELQATIGRNVRADISP